MSEAKTIQTEAAEHIADLLTAGQPVVLDESFSAPVAKQREALTDEERKERQREAGRKAAAKRAAARYIVTIDGEPTEVSGATLAGMRASVSRKRIAAEREALIEQHAAITARVTESKSRKLSAEQRESLLALVLDLDAEQSTALIDATNAQFVAACLALLAPKPDADDAPSDDAPSESPASE